MTCRITQLSTPSKPRQTHQTRSDIIQTKKKFTSTRCTVARRYDQQRSASQQSMHELGGLLFTLVYPITHYDDGGLLRPVKKFLVSGHVVCTSSFFFFFCKPLLPIPLKSNVFFLHGLFHVPITCTCNFRKEVTVVMV